MKNIKKKTLLTELLTRYFCIKLIQPLPNPFVIVRTLHLKCDVDLNDKFTKMHMDLVVNGGEKFILLTIDNNHSAYIKPKEFYETPAEFIIKQVYDANREKHPILDYAKINRIVKTDIKKLILDIYLFKQVFH